MNGNPLITVITPTYNRADLLTRAISSVLNQTYQNWELIIIDDASNDNTEQIVKLFGDSRIIYHKNQKHEGLGVRGIGFGLAKGKYYGYLDDDDELFPHALETAIRKLMELSPQGIRMVWFDMIDAETGSFSGSGLRKEGYVSYEDLLCGRIRGDYWITLDMDLIYNDRSFAQQVSGGRLLWLRLLRHTRAYYIPQILYRAYRQHGRERQGDAHADMFYLKHISSWILKQKLFLDEYGEELRQLCPKHYQERLSLLGTWQILNGEKLTGRKILRESLRFRFSLKLYIFYFLSFILTKNQIRFLYFPYTRFSRTRVNLISRLINAAKLLC